MIKRLLFLLCGFVLYHFQAQAQIFEPGLLVRSSGDTLRGEIENRFWVEPPAFIRFRPAPGSASQVFQPRQLRAVRFTGGRCFRYQVLPIDHAAETRLSELPRGFYTSIQLDSVLAEVLLEGPATMLRVATISTTHYLLQRPGKPTLDLSQRQYLRQAKNGAWQVTDGNNYQGQLKIYFLDCPAAVSAAQAAPFSAEGLVAVAQAYNTACAQAAGSGAALPLAGPRRRVAFQGGVLAGARYNNIDSPVIASRQCADCQARPFGGLYAELLQPSRTAAVYGELSLSRFRNRNSQFFGYNQAGEPIINVYDYRAWLGTARLSIRYFFLLPREQQFLLGLGFELNTIFRPTFTTLAGPPAVEGNNEELVYASPTLLPNLTLGWRGQRFTFSLDGQLYRDNHTEGFKAVYLGTSYALRLGLGYRLGRHPDAAPTPLAAAHP